MTQKPAIVLVHGLWMTPHSWRDWISRYEAQGYEVLAPGWPGIDNNSVASLNKDPSSQRGLSIQNIVDLYTAVIKKLPTPPIIMGHSFGGMIVQLLLSRGLGCAGIAISAAGPAGVNVVTLSVVRSIFPVLDPFSPNGIASLDKKQFHYVFTNELMDRDASDRAWEEDCVPGSAHVLWQGALAGLHKHGELEVDWKKADRAPLLLICGGNDHIVPSAVGKATLKKYEGPAVVEYKEFEGRTHHICGQEGWEEVADYGLKWAEEHSKA